MIETKGFLLAGNFFSRQQQPCGPDTAVASTPGAPPMPAPSPPRPASDPHTTPQPMLSERAAMPPPYSRSPAASRAWARLGYSVTLQILPSLKLITRKSAV